jgi:hypothetical protein
MKFQTTHALAIAASLTLFPFALPAQGSLSSDQSNSQTPAETETVHMVPASAVLLDSIDARKMQPGAAFKAKLSRTVHLANGPELPSGTVLEGTVVSDDMKTQGNSKLVLRFTDAQLKNGQTMPIKAMIVGAYTPGSEETESYDDSATAPPNNWTDGTLQIDQIGVNSGVDLHSKVESENSGVFESSRKDNVKLGRGSDINLAIAERSAGQQNSTGVDSGS